MDINNGFVFNTGSQFSNVLGVVNSNNNNNNNEISGSNREIVKLAELKLSLTDNNDEPNINLLKLDDEYKRTEQIILEISQNHTVPFEPFVVVNEIENFQKVASDIEKLANGAGLGNIFIDYDQERLYFGYPEKVVEDIVDTTDLNILREYFWYGYYRRSEYGMPGRDDNFKGELIRIRLGEEEGYNIADRVANFFSYPPSCEINDSRNIMKDHEILCDAYSKSQGLIVGESHVNQSSKSFIIQNMDILKQQGVKTLFVEFLENDVVQEELDQYLFAESEELPLSLSCRLDYFDRMFGLHNKVYSYRNLVIEAKRNGIRTVGIDASYITRSASSRCCPDVRIKERLQEMNYIAHKVINQEKMNDKFVVLTGFNHAVSCKVDNCFDKLRIPGLNSLIGCPVVLTDPSNIKEVDDGAGVSYIADVPNNIQVVINNKNYQDLSFMEDGMKKRYFNYLKLSGYTNMDGGTLGTVDWLQNRNGHQTIKVPPGHSYSRRVVLRDTLPGFYKTLGCPFTIKISKG